VPFAAGGPPDTVSRAPAQRLAEPLGQSVIVENRPGAATIIGAAPMSDKARKREPATDLQDVLIGANTSARHAGGQMGTRRPQQTEQGPRRGRDSKAVRIAVRIGELQPVEQRADDQIINALDSNLLQLCFVVRVW
ncbi:MAG: hypothetical protein ACKVQT_31110, partial [Burkholderiales bacterium]